MSACGKHTAFYITASVVIALLTACQGGRIDSTAPRHDASAPDAVFEGPVARADCGPGSMPETDIQGRVAIEDRTSGRSQAGYACNLEPVGQFQGEGANWQMAWYEDCAYYDTQFGGPAAHTVPGTQVIDVSDPTHPVRTTNLVTGAMLDPWESLKVNEKRGLLAGVAGWNLNGPVFFDIYNISDDCAQPELLASTPVQLPIGHEGNFAPDGTTYYGSSTTTPVTIAIDVSNPSAPTPISNINRQTHGLSMSEDGNRAYLASINECGASGGNGLRILDTSAVQSRAFLAAAPLLGEVCWTDGSTAQHTVPITIGGQPFILFVDEGGLGAARLIDISDETQPRVASKLKLEIHMPEYQEKREVDLPGTGLFGYEGHYCGVDRKQNTSTVACGYFQSGIRVFDVRDPYHPREIAYYNPPAQEGNRAAIPGSQHANGPLGSLAGTTSLTADWCSAQVRLIPERGELWTTCQDNGFMVLRFTNGVWPF